MNFEESMLELEKIVSKMENGKISIDESLDLFTKGVKLCQECSKQLEEAKGKILILEKQMDAFKEIEFKENIDE